MAKLLHSQKQIGIVTSVLVSGRVYFLAFSLAGPDSTPYREVDQRADVVDLEHPRHGVEPEPSR